jgi:hypothetical protein
MLRALLGASIALLAACGEDAPAPADPPVADRQAHAAGAPPPPPPGGGPGMPPPPGAEGPPGPPPSGQGPALHGDASPPSDDEPPPVRPTIQGPEASVSGRIPLLNQRPREAEAGGSTLWIRGDVPGVAVGQVRFHSADAPGGPLEVICLAEVVDGRFEAEAPPSGPDVYVSVVSLPEGADAASAQPWGALAEPVPLAGADHEVSLSIGARAPWTGRLTAPPDRVVGVGDVNPR